MVNHFQVTLMFQQKGLLVTLSPYHLLLGVNRDASWRVSTVTLWSKIEKITDKIAIQSFTVLPARE